MKYTVSVSRTQAGQVEIEAPSALKAAQLAYAAAFPTDAEEVAGSFQIDSVRNEKGELVLGRTQL